jgi:GcrA cell cycle regulator
MSAHEWPAERTDELRRLSAKGWSAGMIARKLGDGLTRNAVVGKMMRLGLMGNGIVSTQQITRHPRAGIKPVRIRLNSRPRPKVAAPSVVPAGPVEQPRSPPVTILGLTKASCRWPLGEPSVDMLYCGAVSDGDEHSYCPFHCQQAFART